MTAPAAARTPLADGYDVVGHLNRGATLDVYSVWSTERDCLCIAKVVRPDRLDDGVTPSRLGHEGRLLTGLGHPHLVRGLDLVDTEHGPVLVQQTLTGDTLSCLIDSQGQDGLGDEDVALLGRQLCSVLSYLHRHGQLHLDLKPSNIVCTAGTAVLLDLSLAQAPGRCLPGSGTAEYMAPEQVTGAWVDTPTDVWGLGGVLYRALTGRRPFPREGRDAGTLPDLTPLHHPSLAPGLVDLTARCLSPSPPARPTVAEAARRLDQQLTTLAQAAPR